MNKLDDAARAYGTEYGDALLSLGSQGVETEFVYGKEYEDTLLLLRSRRTGGVDFVYGMNAEDA